MRALVVEDDLGLRRSLARSLRTLGFTVDEAADGAQALALASLLDALDVVFLDIHMPGLDGIAVLESLRDVPALADVRIIMVTAEATTTGVLLAMSGGATAYLVKPLTLSGLTARLDELGLLPPHDG